MGCCPTRHQRPTSGCLILDNKIGNESTLKSSDDNTIRHQQVPATVLDAWSLSMVDAANRRSSEAVRQAFLDGTLNPDSRCPLDARQLYTLTKSWNVINRNLSVTAINIFVKMFETNAELKSMFASLKDLTTIAELRASRVLESHVMKVICIVDDVITNLDDMDYVIKLLQRTSHAHRQWFPHFDSEYFWRIEDPFMFAVKEELRDRFTVNVETIYRSTIRFILTQLSNELDNYQASASNMPPSCQSDQ